MPLSTISGIIFGTIFWYNFLYNSLVQFLVQIWDNHEINFEINFGNNVGIIDNLQHYIAFHLDKQRPLHILSHKLHAFTGLIYFVQVFHEHNQRRNHKNI